MKNYEIIIFPSVLYSRETPLTLQEKYRLGVSEKKGTDENIWA
jgi:hypothetical protein